MDPLDMTYSASALRIDGISAAAPAASVDWRLVSVSSSGSRRHLDVVRSLRREGGGGDARLARRHRRRRRPQPLQTGAATKATKAVAKAGAVTKAAGEAATKTEAKKEEVIVEAENSDNQCPICLQVHEESSSSPSSSGCKSSLVKKHCGHRFCEPCISAWMSRDRNDCPVCRGALEPEPVEKWRKEYLESIRLLAGQAERDIDEHFGDWQQGMIKMLKVMFTLHYHHHPEDVGKDNVEEMYRHHSKISKMIPRTIRRSEGGMEAQWSPWPMDYRLTDHPKLKIEQMDDLDYIMECVEAFKYREIRKLKWGF